uniref:EOG090X00QS n=1 Tax=Evadne anonyx TaxID=141404 RepID=A0A9N6ZF58_9CRUS|nr:EOG090X00QS [Evadne anonyx]
MPTSRFKLFKCSTLSECCFDWSGSEVTKLVHTGHLKILGWSEKVENVSSYSTSKSSENEGAVHCENVEECRISGIKLTNSSSANFQLGIVREPEESNTNACPAFTKSCEVGVDNCMEMEECVSFGARRRGGCCRCKEGFARDSNQQCVIINGNTSQTELLIPVTTQSTTTTTKYIRHLAISVSPTTIQLPEPKSNITAIVIPQPMEGEEYTYKWTVLNFPQNVPPGTFEGNNEKTLKLSQLSPGNYTFQIIVNSLASLGEAIVNVTVLAPKHLNKPPVAIIRPTSQTVHLPNNVSILDGSSSTDDTKIVSYQWELEKGPISYQKFSPSTSETLQLKDLELGNYTFKLTVTDSDQESNSAYATLEVVKETDYPPAANAGEAVIVFLPQNTLTLNGNQSTDDHGIVSWEWTLINGNGNGRAVDMQSTRTPYLKLSNLEEGVYRFQLKVADIVGQSSAAEVDVFVKPPVVSQLRVDAGADLNITLPLNWVLLDGSKSLDVARFKKLTWKQLEGPNEPTFVGNQLGSVNATGLTKGKYIFQLTAWDAAETKDSDNITVTVQQKENSKPHADAGGDHSVTLPLKWATLNGTSSSDDLAIQSWLWTREPDSLAAGTVIANSDRTSLLLLTNLVPGKYIFRLTVIDAQGLSDYSIATLTVNPNPRELDVVIITLKSDPRRLKEGELMTIRDQIALLIHQQGIVDINVNIADVIVEPKSSYVVLQFFTTVKSDSGWRTLPGAEVVTLLKSKLRNDLNLMTYPVIDVDTLICQNQCSGHGVCDQVTRYCVCETFWMENFIGVSHGAEHNCKFNSLVPSDLDSDTDSEVMFDSSKNNGTNGKSLRSSGADHIDA